MSQQTTRYDWTYADYARLPDDGNKYEVIDGELLVTPAPSPMHQHILATLIMSLRTYAERHRIGFVLPDVDLLFVSGQFLRPNPGRVGMAVRGGRHRAGAVDDVLRWSPAGTSEALTLEVAELFRPM